VLDKGLTPLERYTTIVSIVTGLALSVVILVQIGLTLTPFSNSIGALAYAVFGIGMTSTFGGLGNRVASALSSGSTRPLNERIAMGSGALIGLGVGLALFLFAKSAIFSALAVGSVFVPGASLVLPAVLSGILFTVTVGSTTASCMDYVSKTWNYVKFKFNLFDEHNHKEALLIQHIRNRPYEYRGSFIGVTSGIVAAVIISALLPHLLPGILGMAVIGLVFIACGSILGGLCSRCGCLLDGWRKVAVVPPAAEVPQEPLPVLKPAPDGPTYQSVPAALRAGANVVPVSSTTDEYDKADAPDPPSQNNSPSSSSPALPTLVLMPDKAPLLAVKQASDATSEDTVAATSLIIR
jgi:hypothetical protein